jgi:hypothetical protein
MLGDRAARRAARIRKWHELIEHHGSELEAWYAIKATPEWEMTFELYPFGVLDEGRRGLALDLMIAADKEAGEPAAPAPPDRRREGKEYPGAMVEEVVRQATAAQIEGRNLGRTLRNELAAYVDDATTYAVDVIFRLMRRGMLADAGREGWLKVAGDSSATPSFINLLDLETRS